MKNRVFGVLIVISIFVVFFVLFPFENEVSVKIANNLLNGLKRMDVVIYEGDKPIIEKQYLIDEKFIRYYGSIDDKIRLKRGSYDVDVFLIYMDKYILKKSSIKIDYSIQKPKIIDIKE
ncbi:MAG: hypothetical protein N2746_08465 [Deltaproteobacteria bacterium]|nr:hypothetical protein [Deltaproteobacteria bacterium]